MFNSASPSLVQIPFTSMQVSILAKSSKQKLVDWDNRQLKLNSMLFMKEWTLSTGCSTFSSLWRSIFPLRLCFKTTNPSFNWLSEELLHLITSEEKLTKKMSLRNTFQQLSCSLTSSLQGELFRTIRATLLSHRVPRLPSHLLYLLSFQVQLISSISLAGVRRRMTPTII